MAVHIMTVLACLDDTVSSELIATSVQTNPVVVRRLLGELNRAGLISAERGKHGGFRLARSPRQISLLDIYRAVMGGQPLVGLHENPEFSACSVSCKVRTVLGEHLDDAQQGFERELKKVPLADIARAM